LFKKKDPKKHRVFVIYKLPFFFLFFLFFPLFLFPVFFFLHQHFTSFAMLVSSVISSED
jgi:hypothetical protein